MKLLHSCTDSIDPVKRQLSEELSQQIAEYEARKGPIETIPLRVSEPVKRQAFTIKSEKQRWKEGGQ